MIKYAVIFFLVSVCTAQWVDSDRSSATRNRPQQKRYPQLPGSFPVYAAAVTSPKPTAITAAPPTVPSPTCFSMFGCADCGNVQVCRPSARGFVPVTTRPCPRTSPYCNKKSGTCSAVPDPDCGVADNFICPDDGYFPDPTECGLYHACNNYKSVAFSCAQGQIYVPDRAECATNATCDFTVKCDAENEIKLKMGDSHFYTYCSTGVPLMVSRCPGEYKLNSTTQVCEPVCQRDGLMTDLANCTRYYKCSTLYISDSLSVPLRENLPCPQNEAFEPKAYQCMPKNSTKCPK